MRSVLFVDDEPRILEGLNRMLRSMRSEWRMEFAPSGQAALAAVKREPFDIVISDMNMPGMNGAQLLSEVKRLRPESIRIVLSGHVTNELILQAVGAAHQYLTKPCSPETVKETIDRIYGLRELVRNGQLRARVSGMHSLASLPTLFQQISAEFQQPRASLERICETIQQDIGMTAKMIQLVSSAYFGVMEPIGNVKQAVTHLGTETINSLMVETQIFAPYAGASVAGFCIESLQRHSVRTAVFARAIGQLQELDPKVVDEAFIAGMLHDAGKLILATEVPERYEEALQYVREEGASVSAAETRVLDATHAQVGAYLFGLWGLPHSIVEAVAYHANPRDCPRAELGTLTLVHVASGLAHELDAEGTPAPRARIDMEYLETLGLEALLPWWREACLNVVEESVGPSPAWSEA